MKNILLISVTKFCKHLKMKFKNIIKILPFLILLALQSCDKPLSVSPPLSPVPIGFIHIDSNPQGAAIYEDGRISGMYTPASLNWLKEKTYVFTLKKKLYRDTSFSVTIHKGDSEYIFIDYLKNPKMRGTIYCNTNAPQSNIYLNDSLLTEKTPVKINGLIPGQYKVKYSKEGYRADSLFVEVESSKISDASKTLIDTTLWVNFTTATSPLPDNAVTAIEVDGNNVKWIGTQTSGVVAYDDKNWTVYNSSNSPLPDNTITTIFVDNTNKVWVGTLNGAAVFDNGNWEVYNSGNCPLKSDYITDIDVQDDGTFWLATKFGLLRHNNDGWYFYDSLKSGLPHRWVTSIAHDDFGNMWIGSNGFGLAKLKPNGEWERYVNYFKVGGYIKAPFPSNIVAQIETWGSEVWITFAPDPQTKIGGLVSYKNGAWYNGYNPLPSNIFHAIDLQVTSERGVRKWISTQSGLVTFVTFSNISSRIVYRKVNTPLPVEDFRGVAFDKENDFIWVATYGGGFYKLKKKF